MLKCDIDKAAMHEHSPANSHISFRTHFHENISGGVKINGLKRVL